MRSDPVEFQVGTQNKGGLARVAKKRAGFSKRGGSTVVEHLYRLPRARLLHDANLCRRTRFESPASRYLGRSPRALRKSDI
jgi:hypothetical protein